MPTLRAMLDEVFEAKWQEFSAPYVGRVSPSAMAEGKLAFRTAFDLATAKNPAVLAAKDEPNDGVKEGD